VSAQAAALEPAKRARSRAWILPWLCAGIVFALGATRFARVASDQLRASFDVLYETPNLRTIELLQQGRNVYDPAVYEAPPFWITVYTPLYHYAVASLPADPANPFRRGREVSLACILIAASALFVAAGRAPWAALLALGAFALIRPVTQNAALLKNDSAALLFSVAAVLAVARGGRWIWIAPLACVLAFASKQSFVAAPIAAVAYLALADRKRALPFALATAGAIAAFVGAARAAWGPGFFFSVFGALQNPLAWSQFAEQWKLLLVDPVFDAVAALFAFALFWTLRRDGLGALRRSPFWLYALVSLAILCATVGKVGSNTNYFVEFTLAAMLALVELARDEWKRAPGSLAVGVASLVVACAAFAELTLAKGSPETYACAGYEVKEQMRAGLQDAAQRIRALGNPRPRILNLTAAYFAYPLPGEVDVNDPYLYFLLWQSGKSSTRPIVERLARREFDGVLAARGLRPGRGPLPFPDLFGALFASYRPALDVGAFEYWTPAASR
jgi:hypothetical protein